MLAFAITRAPCRKVVAARHQKDAPAAGGVPGLKRHSYAVGLRPTLTIYTCWLTRTLHGLDKILDGSASDAARWSLTSTTLKLMRSTGDPRTERRIERTMSDEFDGQGAAGTADIETTLNSCRALASKIRNELRNKMHDHFVDKLSLADVHPSLERAADVLSTVKGSQAQRRQRRR